MQWIVVARPKYGFSTIVYAVEAGTDDMIEAAKVEEYINNKWHYTGERFVVGEVTFVPADGYPYYI